jgi:hypothetical protein
MFTGTGRSLDHVDQELICRSVGPRPLATMQNGTRRRVRAASSTSSLFGFHGYGRSASVTPTASSG